MMLMDILLLALSGDKGILQEGEAYGSLDSELICTNLPHTELKNCVFLSSGNVIREEFSYICQKSRQ